MLHIENIRKQYRTGDLVQTALDGVCLTLRDCEFVAILGPSGSGKTTLLNVIGGLDRYDSGDLIINGISTKKYTDRDWDSYRNHTIGFVFQSYNLIPHQTVLANVELALTISGISKSERRKRAAKALEDVGLGNQLHKKPNQMSGGQMQRVAIARALVNNPDILLADEPTGALDSETSVQVMELLKEVSKDRLVVMVTHNPELAESYANRIVRVKDGKIIGDTNPYTPDTAAAEPPKHKNMGRSSMSIFTALSLSANNLRTKKARTLLTAFAGSIGIIGIALILSLSTGFQAYIDKIQEDTLSSYPLSLQSETADIGTAFLSIGAQVMDSQNADEGMVRESQMIAQVMGQIGSNDLRSFKAYLEEHYDQVAGEIKTLRYSYGITPLIYNANTTNKLIQVNPANLFAEITGSAAMSAYMDSNVFYEMINDPEAIEAQYQVLRGRWPESYNEMVMVLGDPHMFTDYMAYNLGMRDSAELDTMIDQLMEGLEPEVTTEPMEWSYDDLLALEFKLVHTSDLYRYNEEYNVWEDMTDDSAYMKGLINDSETLKIVGIVCPKEDVNATALSQGIAYTADLTCHVIDVAANSEIVKSQLSDEKIDVFTGKEFGAKSEDDEEGLNFEDMITVDEEMLSSAFGMNISESTIRRLINDYFSNIGSSIDVDTKPAQEDFTAALTKLGEGMLLHHIQTSGDGTSATIRLTETESIVDAYLATDEAGYTISRLSKEYGVDADTFRQVFRPLLTGLTTTYVASELASQLPEMELPDVEIPEVTPPEAPGSEEPPADGTEAALAPATMEETPDESTSAEKAPPVADTPPVEDAPPADDTVTDLPGIDIEINPDDFYAAITADQVSGAVAEYTGSTVVSAAAGAMAGQMVMPQVQEQLMDELAGFGYVLMNRIGNSFYVDADKITGAFQFEMDEAELQRLMSAMSAGNREHSYASNLTGLGYADLDSPAGISVYFVDFAGKEAFISFLDSYNEQMEVENEDQVIRYTDLTGIMMSSVKTIIDSVSYVLIAFVSVSLIVSSIMIGIITYISVMERTKEIGVLRAIGASKRNISQVFNAETFIIGLCSGLLGVGITWLLIFPINEVIHNVTGNMDINAQLPQEGAIILVILSMILTIIGGLIPSKKAAQKDPVIALRSE